MDVIDTSYVNLFWPFFKVHQIVVQSLLTIKAAALAFILYFQESNYNFTVTGVVLK